MRNSGYGTCSLRDLAHLAFVASPRSLSNSFAQDGGWAEGDFDGNGIVAVPNFSLLSGNFGRFGSLGSDARAASGRVLTTVTLVESTEFASGDIRSELDSLPQSRTRCSIHSAGAETVLLQ